MTNYLRDKIPEIIKADGRECDIKSAYKEEKYKLLEAKLQDEVTEFLKDKNIEELADVMEVLFGLADSLGYSEEGLLKARDKKRIATSVLRTSEAPPGETRFSIYKHCTKFIYLVQCFFVNRNLKNHLFQYKLIEKEIK